ncbi:MAG: zinc ABC transporter substrate-binding protein [Acinetobacter sp.]|nr:zinc ABC transporter substrate-binding protein [Acinetobacter sp.]MBP8206977.1 zinc ABC transporter substrate-binding protein [Acinetobacter sp.]
MLRILAFCLFSIVAMTSWAQAPMVVSTHPIYLIAKEITQGVEEPKLLLENQTGHDIHMTPAHRKMIQDASLVIWLGKAHEAPLANVLSTNKSSIALLDAGIVQTLPMRNARGVALKNTIDTHVWLDPNNAVRIGFFMAALRSQQLPENKAVYWSNARQFAQKMLVTSQQIKTTARSQPYWALHDAYQYLERPLNLKFAGSLTEDTHMAPTVAQIKYLNDSRPQPKMCLLAEAGASSSQYKKLGNVTFEAVDESFTAQQDFVKAWQALAKKAQICIKNSQN